MTLTLSLCLLGATFAYSQRTVSGTVISGEDNLGIPGASVIVKGSSPLIGTASDFDGHYSLSVPEGAILVFSSTGMQSKEVEVGNQATIDVTLSNAATDLDAVVVIGYGSQKKKEVTGSVASVKQEDFNAGIKTSPMGLLQGKVAGLNITRTGGGDPTNTGYDIQIRGFSTLDKGAGTSPLYIVDGIPVNNIDNIAPDDIASMDVLKDGSAAAIYGTRGTNGVIIITTKRGSDAGNGSAMQIDYSAYVSVSTRIKRTGMATPDEFIDLANISGGAIQPVIYEGPNGETYKTDWMRELTRTAAITHNHNIAISGAGKNFSYRGSVAYKNAEGIAKTSNRSEIIAKLAADQTALDGWLNMQYDFSYMHYKNDYFCGDFKQAAIVNPTYPVYDPTSENGFFYIQTSGQANPVEQMMQKESYQDGNYFRGSIRPTVNIKAVPGLKLSAFAAFEEGTNWNYWYNKVLLSDNAGSNMAGRKPNRSMNRLFETTLDYVNNWGKHSLAAVAGFSYQYFMYDGVDISNGGFPTYTIKYYSIGDGDADKNLYMNMSSYRNSNKLVAVFGRVNYSYAERYLLSASIRREGSSRFGANNKWGWFPAVSLGWRAKMENFLKDVKWVNDLKFRFGFGVTGNNLGTDLQSIAIMSNGGTFWYNGQWVYTYAVARNVNPDLRWEKKYEYNLGVDFSFLNNRLYGTIDAYIRNTKDLLWEYDVPTPPYQYATLLANAGEMLSKGIEFSLSGLPVETKDFSWLTTVTMAFNDNKITKLSDPSKGFNYSETKSGGVGENGIMNTNTQILIEGESVGTFWGYKYLYTNERGRRVYETGAGGITSVFATLGKNDLQAIGNAQPLFTFGWNNVLRYKNFDLSLFFRGVYGNDILNLTRWAYGPSQPDPSGKPSQSFNTFMKDVPDAVLPTKSGFSSYYLEDGSYIKLDNITLGYNIPFKGNKYIRNIRLYFTAQNVFTLTSYSGIDPEVNTTNVWAAGIDYIDFYPNVRNFMLGLNITLN